MPKSGTDTEHATNNTACDGATRSEVVIPLRMHARVPYPFGDGGVASGANTREGERELRTVGVLDLDSVDHATFDEHDARGLERVVEILAEGCDWE
jgi:putative methionine-R-sulfoxide reductase with GAF domain